MPNSSGVSGLALGAIAVGSLFVYAGIKGFSVLKAAQNIVQGTSGSVGQTPAGDNLTGSYGGSSTSPSTTTDSAIANDALKYEGSPYTWGGSPGVNIGPTGIGNHDCSSFATWVLAHDLNLAAPGITPPWNGDSHGPVVAEYVLWSGASGVSKENVQAGDLILFPPDTHMGIATSNTEFISAEDPASGTSVAPISAGPGPWIARRVKAAS